MIIVIILILTVLSVIGWVNVKRDGIKVLLGVTSFILVLLLLSVGSLIYAVRYRVGDIDASVSPDGNYEVLFQSVGEPDWPFGYSHARVLLKSGKRTISKYRFDVANDGMILHPDNWKVKWEEVCVHVTISGEEQDDNRFTLFFDGGIK